MHGSRGLHHHNERCSRPTAGHHTTTASHTLTLTLTDTHTRMEKARERQRDRERDRGREREQCNKQYSQDRKTVRSPVGFIVIHLSSIDCTHRVLTSLQQGKSYCLKVSSLKRSSPAIDRSLMHQTDRQTDRHHTHLSSHCKPPISAKPCRHSHAQDTPTCPLIDASSENGRFSRWY